MLRPNSGTGSTTKDAPPSGADPRSGSAAAEPAEVPEPSGPVASSSPRKERNAAATRQRILDSGEHEFATRGFAGARLREIAETAGVQPALIHHYFTDKQGLYRAVLDRALLPSSTESWTILESRRDLEGLIAGLIDVLLRFYAAHQNLLAILRHESVSGSTVLEELSRERMLPIIQAITLYLEERQRLGEVRDDIPVAEIIVSGVAIAVYPFVEEGLLRVMLPSVIARDEAGLERRKQSIVKLLLDGIRPRPAAR